MLGGAQGPTRAGPCSVTLAATLLSGPEPFPCAGLSGQEGVWLAGPWVASAGCWGGPVPQRPPSLQVGQWASVFLDNASGSSLTVRSGSHFSAVLLGV